MNTTMKMALAKGLLTGFVLAMIAIMARVFINDMAFTEVMTSTYGILTLICVTGGWTAFAIAEAKKEQES